MAIRVGFVTYGLERPAFGISRAAIGLGTALARSEDCDPVFLTTYSKGPFIQTGFRHARIAGSRLLPGLMSLGALELPLLARRARLSLIHDPTGVSPFLPGRWSGDFKRVVTLHDATPFQFPGTHPWLSRFLFGTYIPTTLRNVDAVITVSESAKRGLTRFLELAPARVHVVPNGIDDEFQPRPALEQFALLARLELTQPFILYVGAIEPRKNLPVLVDAFERLRAAFPHLTLAIAGQIRSNSSEARQLIARLRTSPGIRVLGYLRADDLPALYSAASVFCFPSLAEGFGLPVLEAMACGTPVVCSNAASLPEVAGDAGVYIDPSDAASLADSIRQILQDEQFARDLRQRGLVRSKSFSWDVTAARTMDIYRTVLACR